MSDTSELIKKLSPLEKIDQRINELRQKRRQIEARQTRQDRKERARRIIQYGLIAVKYLNCGYNLEPSEFEKVIKERLKPSP